jgi:hypothetical protein
VAVPVAGLGTSPLLRTTAPAYPAAVALFVVATANHFVLDVLAGVLLGGASLCLAGLVDV